MRQTVGALRRNILSMDFSEIVTIFFLSSNLIFLAHIRCWFQLFGRPRVYPASNCAL